MSMIGAPKGLRLHIGLFGRRNVGKSSLLNAITRQDVSIVSDQAGTTTDPVEKPMELLPLGPVLFIDTAGIDDAGALGELRAARTRQVFERTDLGVLVADGRRLGRVRGQILEEFAAREIPTLVVFNKIDLATPPSAQRGAAAQAPAPRSCARRPRSAAACSTSARRCSPPRRPTSSTTPRSSATWSGPGELAVLVVPIDKEAPKGRLILPQVQAIRDLLDTDAMALVVKERELKDALARLTRPPKLVVTDSQAFLKVAADTPPDVPLTSFSILFARFKGDLTSQVPAPWPSRSCAPATASSSPSPAPTTPSARTSAA